MDSYNERLRLIALEVHGLDTQGGAAGAHLFLGVAKTAAEPGRVTFTHHTALEGHYQMIAIAIANLMDERPELATCINQAYARINRGELVLSEAPAPGGEAAASATARPRPCAEPTKRSEGGQAK